MKFSNIFLYLTIIFVVSCNSGFKNDGTDGKPTPNVNLQKFLTATGPNVMKVSVSGSLCSSYKYLNEPCVEVTLCEIDSSNCQTIDNILLDTGSYGLRIFKSKINLSLQNVTESISGNTYATCATFGSGASWGYVASADIVLGNSSLGGIKAQNVPLQIIDASFQNSASNCNGGDVDTTPANSMFNGILGVGLLSKDCGNYCLVTVNNGMYFSCAGNTCTKTTMPLNKQVSNPIQMLSQDNNGYIIALPDVSESGSPSVDGVMILGIGTRDNNLPYQGIQVVTANNSLGYGSAVYTNNTTSNTVSGSAALIDSGTNGWAFPDSTITNCPSPASAFYCPPSPISATVILSGTNGVGISNPFSIKNAYSLPASSDVFNNIGFELPAINHIFILGLPHFLNKSIFFGVEGGASSLNQSLNTNQKLYWAY